MLGSEICVGREGVRDGSSVRADVKSALRRRSLAVAIRAGRGGRRCDGPGVRMGTRKDGCGGGRPRDVRAWESWGMEGGVVIFCYRGRVGGLA